ncbi:MAG: DUF6636 domain-containing protein [Thermoleophilia bacterium]
MRTVRSLLLAGALALLLPVVANADSSGPGFRMPSGLVTCAILDHSGGPRALHCGATYITKRAYDGVGVVALPPGRKARIVGSGNDVLLLLGGYEPDGKPRRWPRPTLRYGTTWTKNGYTCRSRQTGLTCRSGRHGFFLSKERQRYF